MITQVYKRRTKQLPPATLPLATLTIDPSSLPAPQGHDTSNEGNLFCDTQVVFQFSHIVMVFPCYLLL